MNSVSEGGGIAPRNNGIGAANANMLMRFVTLMAKELLESWHSGHYPPALEHGGTGLGPGSGNQAEHTSVKTDIVPTKFTTKELLHILVGPVCTALWPLEANIAASSNRGVGEQDEVLEQLPELSPKGQLLPPVLVTKPLPVDRSPGTTTGTGNGTPETHDNLLGSNVDLPEGP